MPSRRLPLIVLLLMLAAPSTAAAASSLAMQLPPTAIVGKSVTITYSGLAQPTVGSAMQLSGFRELESATCAPNSYDQSTRLYSRPAGKFQPPAGPFSRSTKIVFAATGVWRICAYLTEINGWADAPPSALATATIKITPVRSGAPQCKVPKLRGLSVPKAKAALKRGRCAVGRIKRTPAAKGKPLGSLVVVRQEYKAGERLPRGRPIDITVAPRS